MAENTMDNEIKTNVDQLIDLDMPPPQFNTNAVSTPEPSNDQRGATVHEFQPVDQRAVDRLQDMLEGVIRYSRDMELRFEERYKTMMGGSASARSDPIPNTAAATSPERPVRHKERKPSVAAHREIDNEVTPPPSFPPVTDLSSAPRISTGNMTDKQFREFVEESLAVQQAHNAMVSQAIAMMAQMFNKPKSNKAVPPAKFNPDTDQDLKVFFREFEEYCTVLYPTQKQDWLRLLGSYLQSSYLALYHQLHKADKSYDEIKQNLLDLFTNEDTVRRERAVQDFMTAKMHKNETVRIFAIRLLDLAKKAYPTTSNDDCKEHDTLRQVFLSALPTTINKEITTYLRNHEWLSGNKVTFDQLVNLADRHLQDLKGHAQVSVPEVIDISRVAAEARPQQKPWTDVVKRWRNTSSTTQPPPQPPVEKKSSRGKEKRQKKTTGNRTPKFVRDQQRKSSESSSSSGRSDDRRQNNRERKPSQRQTNQWCSFCDKTTHSKDTCYILNNKCSICKKSGHLSYKCSQYRQPQQQQQQQRRLPENCPVCNQYGHVGKHCPEWQNRNPRRESNSPPARRTSRTSRRSSVENNDATGGLPARNQERPLN
ncbi:UNVERIFIED_CONTAM: hypothetical protein RMT77_016973 [Armadillidium vulgare]